MKRHPSIRSPFAIALAVLVQSGTAEAGESPSGAIESPGTIEGEWTFIFSDDPMQAGAYTPTDPRIVVARHVVRAQLIRPRRAFVVEMLRSAESL